MEQQTTLLHASSPVHSDNLFFLPASVSFCMCTLGYVHQWSLCLDLPVGKIGKKTLVSPCTHWEVKSTDSYKMPGKLWAVSLALT